jgi:hypothetical protein
MSTTFDRLQTASFPDDYADILMDVLVIGDNFLSVKDVLYHFRRLNDDQATEVMQLIADRIGIHASEEE